IVYYQGESIMSVSIERAETAGFSMRYFRFGTGLKTMVILPGLSVQSVMDQAQAVANEYDIMKDDFTVYVFDRREELPEEYTVHQMAEDTALIMQELGLKDVYLFGASQGGMMALEIAIDHPELVRRMVLGSTTSHVRDGQYELLERWAYLARTKEKRELYLEFAQALYPQEIYEAYKDMFIQAAETVTDKDLERFIILTEGTKGFNVTDRLDRIKCPALVIGVYEDAVLDSDATMEIAEKLEAVPDFKLYMYIGHGHAAFDTAPDYRERIYRFFTRQDIKGGQNDKRRG
ncbi:MAG: alpha/beta hydrolase, partial [Lachnospiraceae bacterium]|nr:alpha/beta hydrolase [Lachnospiraceae bacterium]